MTKRKYTEFVYPFDDVPKKEVYANIKLPYGGRGKKILFVLDYVPQEDLHTGRLLGGATGDLFDQLIEQAQELVLRKRVDHQYLAVNFNAYRTVGKSPEYVAEAREAFAKRVKKLIAKFCPEVVMTFGHAPAQALIAESLKLSNNSLGNWYGVPIKSCIGDHKFVVVPSISLNTIVKGDAGAASVLGYMFRHVANALIGRLLYAIDEKLISDHSSILIDSVKKFDNLMDVLADHPAVAIDTEANDLSRVTNKLLTIQFSKCSKYGYVVPMYHKDTPFVPKELKHIARRLKNFFEGENKNDYHVYANAQFDLNLLRHQLDVEYMANDVWDIFAGEYCFHPETLVFTEDGYICIKTLVSMRCRPRVWSYNVETKKTELKRITHVYEISTNDDMYELSFVGGTVRVTENHKVWSASRNDYVAIKDFTVNEKVMQICNVRKTQRSINAVYRMTEVVSVKKVKFCPQVYDITVEDNHNLFACDALSDGPIVLHNCTDENLKHLSDVTGDYFYSLGNLTVQYGSTCYLTAEFGKSDRKNIATTDLTDDLIRYCTFDTIVPFLIHEQQRARAIHEQHAGYETLVRKQLSDLIHGFSKMESTGSGVDVQYLFHLRTPDSPIEKVIQELSRKLLDSKAAQAVNMKLLEQSGVPSYQGGWATDIKSTQVFSLRTVAHKREFFFTQLGLKPISLGKGGVGKLDKAFQEHYKDVPEVKNYTALGKAEKLRNSYVKSFLKMLSTNPDFRSDYRIRPRYHYLKVVTGRTSASDPNLHQIPSRSELGKHIKRLFIARKGYLYVKCDYRVHEVRGWGLISFDRAIALVFSNAKKIRDAFRLHPSPELEKRLKYEADIHVVNALYFFSKTLKDFYVDAALMKELRNAVKGVTFGLIYQMSLKTLAGVLKKDEEFTAELVKGFNKRFPSGMKWITNTIKSARKLFYVENPTGFRRRLWGYCLPQSCENAKRIYREMDRRAVNSPVQGFCAQLVAIGIRNIDRATYKLGKQVGRVIQIIVNNSVHDSVENEVGYRDFIKSLSLIETCLTTDVVDTVFDRHKFEFVVDPEIDFELGSSLSNCSAWNCSLLELDRIVGESLVFQNKELGYNIDIVETTDVIFGQYDDYADWMITQARNLSKEDLDKFSPVVKKHMLKLRKN